MKHIIVEIKGLVHAVNMRSGTITKRIGQMKRKPEEIGKRWHRKKKC